MYTESPQLKSAEWHCPMCGALGAGTCRDCGYSAHTANLTPKRSCNRHSDCDAAELMWLQRNAAKYKMTRQDIPFSFHCHSEDCEDCFGN